MDLWPESSASDLGLSEELGAIKMYLFIQFSKSNTVIISISSLKNIKNITHQNIIKLKLCSIIFKIHCINEFIGQKTYVALKRYNSISVTIACLSTNIITYITRADVWTHLRTR